jgi:DNA-binding transcriptional regulator GbsR (MarR family)
MIKFSAKVKHQTTNVAGVSTGTNGISLNPVEIEGINLFVEFFQALGQPRSVAEIYGLLFISPRSWCLDDLVILLNISKGSGSEGLTFLKRMGAVRAVKVPGVRRQHYTAVAELRKLADRYLQQEILSHFQDNQARLKRLLGQARGVPGEAGRHFQARIQTLRVWDQKARILLPSVLQLLGNGKI